MGNNGQIIQPASAKSVDPFARMSDLQLQLAAARNKMQAMAILSECQRLNGAIKQAFVQQAQKRQIIERVLIAETKGEIRHLKLGIDGDVSTVTFHGSDGEPISVVDPEQGLLLITPRTVEPVVVTARMADGSEKTIVVEHRGDATGLPGSPPASPGKPGKGDAPDPTPPGEPIPVVDPEECLLLIGPHAPGVDSPDGHGD